MAATQRQKQLQRYKRQPTNAPAVSTRSCKCHDNSFANCCSAGVPPLLTYEDIRCAELAVIPREVKRTNGQGQVRSGARNQKGSVSAEASSCECKELRSPFGSAPQLPRFWPHGV
jgi:hypothetical protein